jgi:ABC-2 type transport system ATP-binding protein
MSVRENLYAKAIALGIPDARSSCSTLLDTLGMKDFADARAGDLPLQATRRLSIALALMGSPDLLLLDDPFAGIDPRGRSEMLLLLSKLNMEGGVTVLIAAQETGPYAAIATRYGVVSDGILVCEIAAEELDSACRSAVCVRTDRPERTLAHLETALPGASMAMRSGGRIELTGADVDSVSRILFALPERIIELSEQRRSADEIIIEIAEGRR